MHGKPRAPQRTIDTDYLSTAEVPDHSRGRVSRKTAASIDCPTSARSMDCADELD